MENCTINRGLDTVAKFIRDKWFRLKALLKMKQKDNKGVIKIF